MDNKQSFERIDEHEPGTQSLTAEERETLISWADDDKDKIFIYSSQQPMIRRLQKNPLFEQIRERFNKAYRVYPDPISIEGYLPKRALTIRKVLRKSNTTPETFIQRMKLAKENKLRGRGKGDAKK